MKWCHKARLGSLCSVAFQNIWLNKCTSIRLCINEAKENFYLPQLIIKRYPYSAQLNFFSALKSHFYCFYCQGSYGTWLLAEKNISLMLEPRKCSRIVKTKTGRGIALTVLRVSVLCICLIALAQDSRHAASLALRVTAVPLVNSARGRLNISDHK